MCIDFDGHHSGGSYFVYVNYYCYYKNCLYTHRYKFNCGKKKKQVKSPSNSLSCPELGLDLPFGSGRESGCDTNDFFITYTDETPELSF